MTKGIHGTCETVKIKSPLPGGFVEINADDFDKIKHELFVEKGAKPAASKVAAVPLSATAQKLVDDNGLDVSTIVGTGTDGAITVADVKAAVAAKKAGGTINATPDAIKFAEEAAFDLTGVKGTGENGVITVEDVQDAIEAAEESA